MCRRYAAGTAQHALLGVDGDPSGEGGQPSAGDRGPIGSPPHSQAAPATGVAAGP